MAAATAAYAEYRRHPASDLLGRFVVGAVRLDELSEAAREQLPHRGGEPWRISALAGFDVAADVRRVHAFNRLHSPGGDDARAVVDAIEIRAATAADIRRAMGALPTTLPTTLDVYFEIPVAADPEPLVAELARGGARAKIRTGGVTPDAFPAASDVVRFMRRCNDARVPFKATAGLHHPLRGDHRLTYAPNSACATMYGYLNVFLAAAFMRAGEDDDCATRLLLESDASALAFDDGCASYRGARLTIAQLRAARAFAISFGSCSFREPVDELAALHLTDNGAQTQ